MPERNIPPCHTHGSLPRALHEANFNGIVTVISDIIETVSGVGTVSYSRCAYGYEPNFDGIVRALEDLNTSISGIQGGGGSLNPSGILPGSGIYVQPGGSGVEIGVNIIGEGGVDVTYSGEFVIISGQENSAIAIVSGIAAGPGIDVFASGEFTVVQADIRGEGSVDYYYDNNTGVVSGFTNPSGNIYTAGSGLFLTPENQFILYASGQGVNTIDYDGDLALISGANTGSTLISGGGNVIVSGSPGFAYGPGSIWFDTDQGRSFVYASGNGVQRDGWYQMNAEAFALKSDFPPSGNGYEAPARDGTLWFSTQVGSLFIYDAVTSGWYEQGPRRGAAYSEIPPTAQVAGEVWYDSSDTQLKVWNGSAWVNANS